MKFENFLTVQKIVGEIDAHSQMLKQLEEPNVTVIINANEERGRILYIPVNGYKSGTYADAAGNLVETIKRNIRASIDQLNDILETL